MKTKIIKTVEVKELGAINMESIEASEGQLTVHIHLDKASGELENLLCKMQQDFMKKHPEVEEINLVRVLLQHSSIAVTQRYIGIQSEEIEEALQKHIHLI